MVKEVELWYYKYWCYIGGEVECSWESIDIRWPKEVDHARQISPGTIGDSFVVTWNGRVPLFGYTQERMEHSRN